MYIASIEKIDNLHLKVIVIWNAIIYSASIYDRIYLLFSHCFSHRKQKLKSIKMLLFYENSFFVCCWDGRIPKYQHVNTSGQILSHISHHPQ